MSNADPQLANATGLDAAAIARQQRRLLRAGQTPWLNELLARRMAERLQWIKVDVREALLWQGLHGGGAAALQARYPQARCRAVEEAALPLLEARRRFWQRRDWVEPAQLQPGSVQLVWASQLLHASVNPRALMARWLELLAVDGFLMFSAFGPDSFIELRQLYDREGFGALAPQWIDLHDLGDLLVETGYAEPVMDQERIQLSWADADSLWRDLAAIGGNLHRDRFAGLRTPRWRTRWLQAVESLRGADGRLQLTLEFVCGHAIKPAPRLAVTAETRVSVAQLREQLRQPRR